MEKVSSYIRNLRSRGLEGRLGKKNENHQPHSPDTPLAFKARASREVVRGRKSLSGTVATSAVNEATLRVGQSVEREPTWPAHYNKSIGRHPERGNPTVLLEV